MRIWADWGHECARLAEQAFLDGGMKAVRAEIKDMRAALHEAIRKNSPEPGLEVKLAAFRRFHAAIEAAG